MSNLFLSLYKYQYDITGTSATNLIQNEPVEFSVARAAPFTIGEGSFYTDSVIVKRQVDDVILALGTDYKFVSIEPYLTAASGKEVAGAIELTDKSFVGNLEITYQCVGGAEGKANSLITDLIASLTNASGNPSVDWANIINRPQRFPSELHGHPLSQLTELDLLAKSLDDMTNALLSKDPQSTSGQNQMETIEGILKVQAQMQTAINQIGLNIGSTALLQELENKIDTFETLPSAEENTIGLDWKTIQSWPIATGNTAKGSISIVDADDASQIEVLLSWKEGKGAEISYLGAISTGDKLADVEVQLVSNHVLLRVRTVKDARVRAKWQHVL